MNNRDELTTERTEVKRFGENILKTEIQSFGLLSLILFEFFEAICIVLY